MPILVEQNPPRRRWIGVAVMAGFIALGYVVARPAPRVEFAVPSSSSDDSRSFVEAAEPAADELPAEPESVRR